MTTNAVTVASTTEVDVPDRVAFWEDYNHRMLVSLRCMSYHDQGLQAQQRNLDLGDVKLAEISGNAHVIDRTGEHIADTPKDSIFLTHLVSGSAFFLHAGGSIRLGAGDTILYDPSRPYMFGFETDMQKVLLDIPRASLAGLGSVDFPIVRPHDAESRHRASTLAGLMRGTIQGTGETSDEKVSADLLDATVSLMWPGEAAAASLCATARHVIAARLTDLDLTAERVAHDVGVSPRHLNRVFVSVEGLTVTQFITRERLDGARRELADPCYAGVRVADIAARWGFSSQSHLARVFAREFGCRPSDLRGQRSA